MSFIADLHTHSHLSRATSKQCTLEGFCRWAQLKGVRLVGTGDFTHPMWLSEMKQKLRPAANGLYEYNGITFMLTGEVSNIFQVRGRGRRVHILIFAPSIEVVERINDRLSTYGKLRSDGRPMLGLAAEDLVDIILGISSECVLIPAHAWTPWYSVFGSNSGFDSLEECFGKYTKYIFAIETGLSSDPAMNWRLSALDRVALVSNSDAHSCSRLGREANVFDTELNYPAIVDAIRSKDPQKFLYTIEFFPEEGKYHYDGHRNCNQRFSPKETMRLKNICPSCGRLLTRGVMYRVEQLADRPEGTLLPNTIPYRNLVPLREILGAVLGRDADTAGVEKMYKNLVGQFGSEFALLLDAEEETMQRTGLSPRVIEAILRVRKGQLHILPGYDGEFGTITIFPKDEATHEQLELF